MRRRVVVSLAGLAVLLPGCGLSVIGAGGTIVGNGSTRRETRAVAPFTKVEVSSMFEATVTPGAECSVTLDVDENLLPLVTTRVAGGRLEVRMAEGAVVVASRPQRVAIVAKGAEEVVARAAAKVSVAGVSAKAFRVESEGAGSVALSGLEVGTLEVKLGGAGRAILAGRGESLRLEASGSSRLQATDAAFESAAVELSGVSKCEIEVTGSVAGSVDGACSLEVFGNPPVKAVKASKSGRVSY